MTTDLGFDRFGDWRLISHHAAVSLAWAAVGVCELGAFSMNGHSAREEIRGGCGTDTRVRAAWLLLGSALKVVG
jgi:hypothetical protein